MYLQVRFCVYVCLFVRRYACKHTLTYLHTHIYIYTYIYIYTHLKFICSIVKPSTDNSTITWIANTCQTYILRARSKRRFEVTPYEKLFGQKQSINPEPYINVCTSKTLRPQISSHPKQPANISIHIELSDFPWAPVT